jgi:hypothetical protein
MKGTVMKFRQIITANILFFSMIAAAHAAGSPKATPTTPGHETNQNAPSDKGTSDLKECGRGYVVGVWMGADGWDDWVVSLSQTGQSKSNSDVQIYRAYSYGLSNQDAGKIFYATVLQAKATGAMVEVLDDLKPFPCTVSGTGEAKGKQFKSVKIWFP